MLDQVDRRAVFLDARAALPCRQMVEVRWNTGLSRKINSLKDDAMILWSGEKTQRDIGSGQKANAAGSRFATDRSLTAL